MFGKKKPKPEEAEATETDAPEGEGAEGEVAEGKKKLPLKLVLMGAAGALVVLGGGGTAAYMFLAPKGDKAGAQAEKPKKKEKGGHAEKGKAAPGGAVVRAGPDGVTFYTLPDIVVNMQTADGRPTFLKLKLTFELPDEHTVEVLDPNMPRLQDMFQTFLRELRPEDLNGSQGSYQLRMEILRRVNLVVAPAKVNAVLIEEMLIN
ncbi:flagellar basal body-associated FliL family protein [Phenylobacterium terrae]|uniref:Flagellar protein FliL n=1 Tax=Phenylobacterium terrae TaxID=2665495 RepID=A0ABW4MXC0_9CAUL